MSDHLTKNDRAGYRTMLAWRDLFPGHIVKRLLDEIDRLQAVVEYQDAIGAIHREDIADLKAENAQLTASNRALWESKKRLEVLLAAEQANSERTSDALFTTAHAPGLKRDRSGVVKKNQPKFVRGWEAAWHAIYSEVYSDGNDH